MALENGLQILYVDLKMHAKLKFWRQDSQIRWQIMNLKKKEKKLLLVINNFFQNLYNWYSKNKIMIDFSLTDEQKMFVETTYNFVEKEMIPYEDTLEKTDFLPKDLAKSLKKRSIELGLMLPDSSWLSKHLVSPFTGFQVRSVAPICIEKNPYLIQTGLSHRPTKEKFVF